MKSPERIGKNTDKSGSNANNWNTPSKFLDDTESPTRINNETPQKTGFTDKKSNGMDSKKEIELSCSPVKRSRRKQRQSDSIKD
jgi:hypothetical protein